MTKLIAILIRSQIDSSEKVRATFHLLRLRKRLVAVILENTKENMGMLHKVKDSIAYGEISPETLKQLLMKRGKKSGDKPIEIGGKILDEFAQKFLEDKAKLEDIKVKPFFRLHPPKGGFKKSVRLPFPRGVLGNQGNKINDLVMRML
jgi:large subunit ribosomal protein L30